MRRIVLALWLLVGGATALQADMLGVEEYGRRLNVIADAIDQGRHDDARVLARSLIEAAPDIVDDQVSDRIFVVDEPLLRAVETGDGPTLRSLSPLLRETATALGGAAPTPADVAPLAPAAEATGPQPGGTLPLPTPPSFWRRLETIIQRTFSSIGDLLLDVVDWLEDLLALGPRGMSETPLDTTTMVVLIVVLTLLILWLAYRALRRGGTETTTALPPSQAVRQSDDDPRSRTANAWVDHARALGEAGRHREAIRAWYHAVLATLVRHGLVAWRKDRTNWEYVTAIGPERRWRPAFISLTRVFETAWYGRRADARALATSASEAETVLRALETS
ncbi:MAG: DUF4129 domain-containing protein [Acidobacteriota bacterium]